MSSLHVSGMQRAYLGYEVVKLSQILLWTSGIPEQVRQGRFVSCVDVNLPHGRPTGRKRGNTHVSPRKLREASRNDFSVKVEHNLVADLGQRLLP